jgi:PBSX family phage terminase large subunit
MPATASRSPNPRAERPPYVPRGAAFDLLHSHAPEVLISGPAGTGKSVACMFKLHLFASSIPGFRALFLRRTRKSLTDSGLVTFERDVLPPSHEARGKVKREGRHSYRYANGSEIVVGGLDESSRIMSSDYDMAYVQEATEVEEAAWEDLSTRVRAGRVPYLGRADAPFHQMIADCNPDRPSHWLYRRSGGPSGVGRCRRLESRHEDNPQLYDGTDWTPRGAEYLARLDALTGPRKLRLRHGRWVQSEGIVYPEWDPALHLIDPFAIPHNWPRYWGIDFGYTNAFCCLMAAADGDGRLFVYRQVYHTQKRVDEHAARMKHLTVRDPRPAGIVADPEDREGRETLAAAGFSTVAAYKAGGAREIGIQAVARRLCRAGDGRPRLYVMRDSLDQRDARLDEARRPACLEEEIDGYVWDGKGKDQPAANQDDHAMDALRYLCFGLDAPREAEVDEGESYVFA